MKYLKLYKKFFEDGGDGGASGGDGGGTAYTDASVSGMGPVVSAQPGLLPGTTGTVGSGDVSRTFKKEKRKKGKPSEVSDLRDLSNADVVNIKESNDENIIKDCLLELIDEGFNLLINDTTDEGLTVSLQKRISDVSLDRLVVKSEFDKNGIINTKILGYTNELSDFENKFFEISEDASVKLINFLDYQNGKFTINFTPYVTVKMLPDRMSIFDNKKIPYSNIDIHIKLYK